MNEDFGNPVVVQWAAFRELFEGLVAPCSRRGLACHLEPAYHYGAAIVMHWGPAASCAGCLDAPNYKVYM